LPHVEDWVALLEGPGVHDGLHVHLRRQDAVGMRLLIVGPPEVVLLGVGIGVGLRNVEF
jgi:hypothetical protein